MSGLGRRIQVVGNSGAGKSTLGRQLAELLGVPFVELDALHFEPGWKSSPLFRTRVRDATRGDGWVVSGSYLALAEEVFWDRLDTVIYLDLPLPQLFGRTLVRSWRRWRSRELLWGTNYESFWPQLRLWENESVLGYMLKVHRARRREMVARMADPRWKHIRFVRLRSSAEVDQLRRALGIRPSTRS